MRRVAGCWLLVDGKALAGKALAGKALAGKALPAARCPLPGTACQPATVHRQACCRQPATSNQQPSHGQRAAGSGQRAAGNGQRLILTLLLIAFTAAPVLAGVAGRDLFLPIAGRAVAADGRGFFTTLWITNTSSQPAAVAIAFLASGTPNPSPRSFAIRLAGNETRVIDSIGEEILGAPRATGALRVTSDRELVVQARVYGQLAGQSVARSIGTTWEAVSASAAIGNGESALLQGVDAGFRYKLYIVETTNHPLTVAIALLDRAGHVRARKQLYLGAHEHRAWDLAVEFPNIRDAAVVRIRGVNGSGRIIAGGAQIAAESQDVAAFEMVPPQVPRPRVAYAELFAWGAVAIAIVAAALRGRG